MKSMQTLASSAVLAQIIAPLVLLQLNKLRITARPYGRAEYTEIKKICIYS